VRKILVDKRQQNYARGLYCLTKSLDESRLISTNDGWENLDLTDLITVHDYAFDSRDFVVKYGKGSDLAALYPQGRKLMAEGCAPHGQPVIFSEFGGIALCNDERGWGYNAQAKSCDEFYSRLANLLAGIRACDFQGYCYTQLCDVQQEMNGLLSEARDPKYDIKKLKALFTFEGL
jgi:hypothetical protein